jgi:excisionase family DNA binding protein
MTTPPYPAAQQSDLALERLTLTPAEAAQLLGVGMTEFYARLQRGETPFPVRRMGRKWLIPTRPFLDWLACDSLGMSRDKSVCAMHKVTER